LLLERFITESNANKYSAIGTLLAAVVGIFALFFIGYQAVQLRKSVDLQLDQIEFISSQTTQLRRSVELQAKEFLLEHRPYLYIHLPSNEVEVGYNEQERAWFGGGELRFRNVGKDTATITETNYMVASDTAGVVKFREWFEKDYGGFPDITNVFPGQEDVRVPCHPEISTSGKRPKLLYIGAVVSYVGPSSKKTYWYKFSQLYVIELKKGKDNQGQEKEWSIPNPLKPEHDWDKNTNSKAPILKEPVWKDYLSKPHIRRLTEAKGAGSE